MNVYVTELEKWVESGLSTFEIRRLVAEIYFKTFRPVETQQKIDYGTTTKSLKEISKI